MKEEIIILGSIAGIIIIYEYYDYIGKTAKIEDVQTPVPTTAPIIEQTPVPTTAPIIEQTSIPTTAPIIEQTSVPTTAPIIEQTSVPTYTIERFDQNIKSHPMPAQMPYVDYEIITKDKKKYIYPEPPPGYPNNIHSNDNKETEKMRDVSYKFRDRYNI